MRVLLGIVLLGATALAAPVPKELKKPQRPQVIGEWEFVSIQGYNDGQEEGWNGYTILKFSSNADKLVVEMQGDGRGLMQEVNHDFAVGPAQLDLLGVPGIVRVVDGQLQWCLSQPHKPTPTKFEGGDGNYLTIWKRVL